MVDKIYGIVVADLKFNAEFGGANYSDYHFRTAGFFRTFEGAEHSLLEYSELLWECTGRYALIESINFGLIQMYRDPINWYSYNRSVDLYVSCKCPSIFEGTVSFWG